jgi:hypothetical protein
LLKYEPRTKFFDSEEADFRFANAQIIVLKGRCAEEYISLGWRICSVRGMRTAVTPKTCEIAQYYQLENGNMTAETKWRQAVDLYVPCAVAG